ncbi:MAG: ParB N-terminal domain-containing protein [Thomasclavelia sp.]|jgi:ParB-like chromosome segregation protein Spo0J|nr:ParB N-terminal domain-containing protein [Thomasclavelia sp.]
MIIKRIDIEDISFNQVTYDNDLLDSIKRVGLTFPIKVALKNNKYVCIDGNKRLSAIHDLIKLDSKYNKLKKINIIVVNDGSVHSNDCWRDRNTH